MEVQRVFREMQSAGEGKVPLMAQPPLVCDV